MKLLDDLKSFLRDRDDHPLARDESGQPVDVELQAATAILLIEAGYGDTEYLWREHRTIVKGLERDFGLGYREVRELLGRANEIRPPVVKLSDVTDVLRDRYSVEQREEVLRLVWRVVEADGSVGEWEQSFADHVAGALGLTREEADAARDAAEEA